MQVEAKDVRVGSWVRFYRGGVLVIAEVRYARQSPSYPYKYEALTDDGSVNVEHVLEVRNA